MKRGLIIKKQYLDRIFDNGKIWEMRSTKTTVRGRIALIESGSGMIVGEAELIDCLPPIKSPFEAEITKKFHHVEDLTLLKTWRYPWWLYGAKRYAAPVPYKHPQGAVVWVNLDR